MAEEGNLLRARALGPALPAPTSLAYTRRVALSPVRFQHSETIIPTLSSPVPTAQLPGSSSFQATPLSFSDSPACRERSQMSFQTEP